MKTSDEIKKGLACCAKSSLEACEHCPYRKDCDNFNAGNLYRDALAYINQLEARVPKWISVHDMKPADNTANLVFMRNSENRGFYTFDIQAYIRGDWNGVFSPWEVTHWMPMPKLPMPEIPKEE